VKKKKFYNLVTCPFFDRQDSNPWRRRRNRPKLPCCPNPGWCSLPDSACTERLQTKSEREPWVFAKRQTRGRCYKTFYWRNLPPLHGNTIILHCKTL